jgi:glycosyltransferase involved in cell wall biosynthesis
MNILFYTPLCGRSRDIESLARYFAGRNHRIFLLTQGARGELHRQFSNYAEHKDADVSHAGSSLLLLLKRVFVLIRYCSKHRIDIVYAHLEPCNFIAVLAQYFIRARVVICRHHSNGALYSFNKMLSYRLTYRLARHVVVVSEKARKDMIEEERIKPNKIYHINLGYDFSLYELPDSQQVQQLRASIQADVVLLTVNRFTVYKRPELSVQVLRNLLAENINAKLIILGDGERKSEILNMVQAENLQHHCILPGYVSNVLEYMAAADLLLHPSIEDSSSITIKEAALVNLPVIVCRDVGDFDEVIEHQVNGFLVDKDNFVTETVHLVKAYLQDPENFKQVAQNLIKTVKEKFSVNVNGPLYEKYFHHLS